MPEVSLLKNASNRKRALFCCRETACLNPDDAVKQNELASCLDGKGGKGGRGVVTLSVVSCMRKRAESTFIYK